MTDPIEDDDLMRDIPGEEIVPADLNAAPPDFFNSIWDDPHIVRVVTDTGSK